MPLKDEITPGLQPFTQDRGRLRRQSTQRAEKSLEKNIMHAPVDFDDNDALPQIGLLYALAGQMLGHLHADLICPGKADALNVPEKQRKTIAKEMRSRMYAHFFMEARSFSHLKAYTLDGGDRPGCTPFPRKRREHKPPHPAKAVCSFPALPVTLCRSSTRTPDGALPSSSSTMRSKGSSPSMGSNGQSRSTTGRAQNRRNTGRLRGSAERRDPDGQRQETGSAGKRQGHHRHAVGTSTVNGEQTLALPADLTRYRQHINALDGLYLSRGKT